MIFCLIDQPSIKDIADPIYSLGKESATLGTVFCIYLLLKLILPYIKPPKTSALSGEGVSTNADVRVLIMERELLALKEMVPAVNDLVAEVRRVVDSIADLRVRVQSLEEDRRT